MISLQLIINLEEVVTAFRLTQAWKNDMNAVNNSRILIWLSLIINS